MFKKANVVKYMKACKEINIAFIPYEEQVSLKILSSGNGDGVYLTMHIL